MDNERENDYGYSMANTDRNAENHGNTGVNINADMNVNADAGYTRSEQREVMPTESFRQRSEMARERKRKQKRRRKKNHRGSLMAVLIVTVVALVVVGSMLYKKYSPCREVLPLSQYFDKIDKDQVYLIEHDNVLEDELGFVEDGEVYFPYNTVVNRINKRFYFDASENILSYATATKIIRVELGSSAYSVNKSKKDVGYTIVKAKGEDVYLALSFVKEYSNIEYQLYDKEAPKRLVFEDGWGETYSYYNVEKDTKLRTGAGIKCKILESLQEKDKLRVIQTEQELESYAKVMTADGVTGYVLKKYLSKPYDEVLENDYEGEEYAHISMNKTVCMAWHQVTGQAANGYVLNMISATKGLNVISPTWFSLDSNNGTITSLASDLYVQRAHLNDVQVWALCDDFKVHEGKVDLAEVLGNTKNRDKLVNRLLANALEYNLDGINIDFEYVTSETSAAYLEFLRELSVKCRNNGLVLSVDSYVPKDFSAFYDREEQGKIVDYVVVMGYDEHYGGSKESGSVSSIGFVKEAMENITAMVDPDRVIMGIPFYTRFWKEVKTDDGVKVTSNTYGMNQQQRILTNNGVSPTWDDETGQNYVQFDYNGATYKMWMEDDKSIDLKLQTIFSEYNGKKIAGISAWKLGLENSSVWNVIQKYTN